jgi:hypothetical protein
MINRIKVLVIALIILSFVSITSCVTINEAPKSTSTLTSTLTSTSTSMASNNKEGLAPLQSFVASPDYNPAVSVTQIVQVQSQIDQLFEQKYNINYYDDLPGLSERYAPHDENALQSALNDLKSITQWSYAVDKFDCSNMSALTQFYLANAGFRTIMVVGTDAQLDEGHCWVVVLLTDPTPEAIPIECTTQGGPAIPSKVNPNVFINHGITDTQSYNDYLTGGWAVQDIYQAAAWAEQNYGETLGSDNEFNWWDTTQVNWSMLTENTPTTTSSVITSVITVSSIQPPSVDVNPESASTGQTITVTGQGFTPNSIISTLGISIGGKIGNASSIPIDANGNFSYSFILSAVPDGTYTVKVTDVVGRSGSANLTVTTPNTTPPPTISLNPTSGSPGSTFTVNGYNFTPYGTINPTNILFNSVPSTGNTFNIDSTGDISFTLTLSANQSLGTYGIVVTDSSGKSASANFTVLTQIATTTLITTTQSFSSPNVILTPTSGSPGSVITINGYNFTPNGTVKSSDILFNNVPSTGTIFNIDSTGHVSCTLTLSATQSLGTYSIVVTDSSGKSASANFTVLTQITTTTLMTTTPTQISSTPNIILTPNSGSQGSTFTINGYNFTPNGTVKSSDILFNNVPSTGTIFNIDSTGHVSCTLTLSATQSLGTYSIVVTDSSGRSASANFTVLSQTTTTTIMTTTTTTSVLYPTNGATNVPVSGVTFTWPAASGSGITYQFALAQASANTTSNEFAILDYSDNTTTNTETLQETLQYNKVYWWEVRDVSLNSSGVTSYGAWTAQMFTTASH